MKYAPLIVSISCLVGGVVCLALGHETAGTALVSAFLAQFVPGAHTSLAKAVPDAE